MKNRPLEEQSRYCEKEAINVSLANLLTFPWIKEKVTRKELGVHGWLYDVSFPFFSSFSQMQAFPSQSRLPLANPARPFRLPDQGRQA